MEKTFKVPNISCGHCVHTVKMEVGDIAGVQRVDADEQSKQVTVVWDDPATWDQIRDTLVEINYPPEGLVQIS
ncbi:MAG: heavy-metal-associated domain-containing protein [Chloroflexota bacterium]